MATIADTNEQVLDMKPPFEQLNSFLFAHNAFSYFEFFHHKFNNKQEIERMKSKKRKRSVARFCLPETQFTI